MSHRHFCDYAGHYWACDGTALRPLTGSAEPSECYCLRHRVAMEDGDHSGCPVELLACPEHRDEQLLRIGMHDLGDLHPSAAAGIDMFCDQNGTPIVGFCLWCDKDFYSVEEAEAHNEGNGCPVFRLLKGKQ